jgi:two-component system sensor histidine kinase RstB
MVNPQRDVALHEVVAGDYGALDMRLMERVLDNLVNNACATATSGFRSA